MTLAMAANQNKWTVLGEGQSNNQLYQADQGFVLAKS